MGLLTEVLLRGLPTQDDCRQEDRVLILDERHQVHVVLSSDDENALAAVTLGFGWSRISSRSPRSMWKTISSNPTPRSPELRVLRVVPVEVLHRLLGYHDV